jgi:hypothetical protein
VDVASASVDVASTSVDADTCVGGTAADAGSQVTDADASFQHVDADPIANRRARHPKRSQTPGFAADSAAATGPASFRNSSSSGGSSGSSGSLNAGDATFRTSATGGATPTERVRSGQQQQRRPTIEEVVVELEHLFTQAQHDTIVSSAAGLETAEVHAVPSAADRKSSCTEDDGGGGGRGGGGGLGCTWAWLATPMLSASEHELVRTLGFTHAWLCVL